MQHRHLAVPNHSPAQAKMFFALSNQLGYNPEEVKWRAKLRFSLECFNELTVTQINELIERLLLKIEEQEDRIANSGYFVIYFI